MSRLYENVSKTLLKNLRIPVPEFDVAHTPEEAEKIAEKIGKPVVIKALIPVGKKGKAGAIKFADTPKEAAAAAGDLLGTEVRFYPVENVLIEEKLNIACEMYLAVMVDSNSQKPVVIVSREGGVDIEEIAKIHPEKINTKYADVFRGLEVYQAKEIWADIGLTGSELKAIHVFTARLYRAFLQYDATIIEVNPLVITSEGKACAAGVLMGVDDDALFRHPELEGKIQTGSDRAWRPMTPLEKQIEQVDRADPYRGTARYTEIEGGNIGFFCGGGGGSLLMYDTVQKYGGKPANYTEFGGNPAEEKVYGLAKGILSKKGVEAFLLGANITNNTQTDIVAKGIIRAFRDLNIDPEKFPAIIRLAGVNEDRARELFSEANIEYHGDDITMEDAGRLIVEKMKQIGVPV